MGGAVVNKKYIVRLTKRERARLEDMVAKGRAAAYRIRHANILLKADADGPGWTDEHIAEAFGCHVNTARNVRQRLVEQGLEAALEQKKREKPPRERVLDGRKEARLLVHPARRERRVRRGHGGYPRPVLPALRSAHSDGEHGRTAGAAG